MPLPYYVSPEQMRQGEAQPQASRANSNRGPGGPA
jgi:hypothetical protein